MVGFKKRTYSTAFKKKASGRKKSRFTVKRRGSKSTSYSSLSTRANGFGYRGRKTSALAFRKHLWNDTIFKAHYRSVGGVINTNATPASAVLARSVVYNAVDNSTSSLFWTAAGGAIDIDGGTIPLFTDDIIIRGGIVGVDISNTDATAQDVISMKVILGWTPDTPASAGFNSATRPIGWDSTMFPEFNNYIIKNVLKEWNLVIKPGDRVTLKERIGVKKVDQVVWTASGRRLYWALVANSSSNNNTADFTFTTFYSLSFSGDAVGTT